MVSKLDILILSDDRHFHLGPFTPHHFTPRYPQIPETRINATKRHRPRSSISAKTVPLVRLQGFEPWTPWLRVRCSTNWAKDAYLIVCLSFFVSFVPQDMLYYTLWFEESQHLFLIFFIFFFFIFYIFIWCNFVQWFFYFWQWISDLECLAFDTTFYTIEISPEWIGFSFFQTLSSPLSLYRSGSFSCRFIHSCLTLPLIYYMKTGRSVYRPAQ